MFNSTNNKPTLSWTIVTDHCELSVEISLPPNKATINLSQAKRSESRFGFIILCVSRLHWEFVIALKYRLVEKISSSAIIQTHNEDQLILWRFMFISLGESKSCNAQSSIEFRGRKIQTMSIFWRAERSGWNWRPSDFSWLTARFWICEFWRLSWEINPGIKVIHVPLLSRTMSFA